MTTLDALVDMIEGFYDLAPRPARRKAFVSVFASVLVSDVERVVRDWLKAHIDNAPTPGQLYALVRTSVSRVGDQATICATCACLVYASQFERHAVECCLVESKRALWRTDVAAMLQAKGLAAVSGVEQRVRREWQEEKDF